MIGKAFAGILHKYTNHGPSKDEDAYVEVAIKHTCVGDVQSLMKHFEKELSVSDVQKYFNYPVKLKKFTLEAEDIHPLTHDNYYSIEFDEMQFYAKFLKLDVTRKFDNGTDVFDYTFVFKKEICVDDSKNVLSYLKHKEENEDGKLVLVEYTTLINLAEQPKESNSDLELL